MEAANSIELRLRSYALREVTLMRFVLFLSTPMELSGEADCRPYISCGSSITHGTREIIGEWLAIGAAFTNVPVEFDAVTGEALLKIENLRFSAAHSGESGFVIGHIKAGIVGGEEVEVLPPTIPIARAYGALTFTIRDDRGFINAPLTYDPVAGLNENVLDTGAELGRFVFLQFTEGFPNGLAER